MAEKSRGGVIVIAPPPLHAKSLVSSEDSKTRSTCTRGVVEIGVHIGNDPKRDVVEQAPTESVLHGGRPYDTCCGIARLWSAFMFVLPASEGTEFQ